MDVVDMENQCIFCKNGKYQVYSNKDEEGIFKIHDDLGLKTVGQNNWVILICDSCGNMQYFRDDLV